MTLFTVEGRVGDPVSEERRAGWLVRRMLWQTIRRYQNRPVEAAQVVEEVIGLARELRAANARGEALGSSEDEQAFSDALGINDSAVQVQVHGEETLHDIARELVETVRSNLTIDRTLRENVRAKLRVS